MFRKIGLVIALSVGLIQISSQSANAMDTFDQGVMMDYQTCLSTLVPGTFFLQTKASGTSSWKNQGSSKAWDDRNTEDGSCPQFAVGVFWTPKQLGVFDIRLFNPSNGKSYKASTVKIAGQGAPVTQTQPQVQYVKMPNLVGMTAYQAGLQVSSRGYRLGRWALPSSTGFAPKISCQMNAGTYVVKQSPAAGTQVANDYSTHVQVWVNCG
jgi:hypothetical protein